MRRDIEAARVGHLRRRQVLGAAAATCMSPVAVRAQPKVLRIVAPFPPGGSTDILARTLADKLAPALGQTVAVENKVGANGAIGTESVVKAVPDGQTLLVTTNAGITINPLLYKKMVNPMEGLAPLVQLVELELVLAVRADSPVRSIKDFAGKVTVVFFGYTQCPDVCPTTLQELVEVKQMLGAQGDKLQGVFVSLDPERDTPEVLKAYVGNFDPSMVALTGTPEQVAAVAKDFKVFFRKVEGKVPGAYTLDHTAGLYMYDPQGRLRAYHRYGAGAQPLVADAQVLLAEK